MCSKTEDVYWVYIVKKDSTCSYSLRNMKNIIQSESWYMIHGFIQKEKSVIARVNSKYPCGLLLFKRYLNCLQRSKICLVGYNIYMLSSWRNFILVIPTNYIKFLTAHAMCVKQICFAGSSWQFWKYAHYRYCKNINICQWVPHLTTPKTVRTHVIL